VLRVPFNKKCPDSGERNGSCTITMCFPTPPSQCSFWCRTTFQPTPSTIFSTSFSMWLPALPKSQDWAEMSLFSFRRMNSVKMTTGFTAIQEGDFKICFQQWQYSWSKCACAEKQYFKGDWFMSYLYIYIYIQFLYELHVSSANFLILLHAHY